MSNLGKILHRYNDGNSDARKCYEVWEFDNYANKDFYCDVYMSRSSAYRAVHGLEQRHAESGGDRWDYYWILEVPIEVHNEIVKIGFKNNGNFIL